MSERHDSGCKVKMPLPAGVHGSAVFKGENDEHRLVLERTWDDAGEADPFALWSGMNPSGAEALVNDLTILKECHWTKLIGLTRYVKTNTGTYRWTQSTTLSAKRAEMVHPDNLATIRALAAEAQIIVFSTGKPPDVLLAPTRTLFQALKRDGRKVMCLGTTKDGWPKHSSRLGYFLKDGSLPFEEYRL